MNHNELAKLLSDLSNSASHSIFTQFYTFSLFHSFLLVSLLSSAHHFWWVGVGVAMSVRGSCQGLVFDKCLKLGSSARSRYTAGRIANLANVDSDNVSLFMWSHIKITKAKRVVIVCIQLNPEFCI